MRDTRALNNHTDSQDTPSLSELSIVDTVLHSFTENMCGLVDIIKKHSLAYNLPSVFESKTAFPDIDLVLSQALKSLKESPSGDHGKVWIDFKTFITCAARKIDNHSFLLSWTSKTTPLPTEESSKIDTARAAVITVPTLGQPDVGVNMGENRGLSYRNALREAIKDAKQKKEQGSVDRYVIDLRGNRGGDMWPMYAGILPLIGADDVGAIFTVSEGEALSRGTVEIDGKPHELYRLPYHLAAKKTLAPELLRLDDGEKDLDTPITVLVDEQTSSSGEIIAIILRGRANTQIEGVSGGASTSNMTFKIHNDTLNLTAGVCADRNGVASTKPLGAS